MKSRLAGLSSAVDFFDCIRKGHSPKADERTGPLSAALVHRANIATLIGHTLQFDPVAEQFIGDEEANGWLRRHYREGHWAIPKGLG